MDNECDDKSAAYGIAMQVVHQGHDSLSPKQRFIYESQAEAMLNAEREAMWILLLPLDILIVLPRHALPFLFIAALWVSGIAVFFWVLFLVVRAAVRSAHRTS